MPSSQSTTSVRFLPKWIWRISIIYILIVLITYGAAFPIRYRQLLDSSGATLATAQIAIEYVLIIVLAVLGLMLVIRRPNEVIAVMIGVGLIGIPNFTGLSHLATHLHPIFHLSSGFMLITGTSFASTSSACPMATRVRVGYYSSSRRFWCTKWRDISYFLCMPHPMFKHYAL